MSQHNSVTTQQFHNSKSVIFQEKLLKVLKSYNFLWVQRRHNCSPAASFANCVMTLYLLKVHLKTSLSIPMTQKNAKFWVVTLLSQMSDMKTAIFVFDFMFQLNVPFVYYIYHIPLHVSSNIVLIIRRIHCIHTASDSLYVTLLRWPLSAQAVRGALSWNMKSNITKMYGQQHIKIWNICVTIKNHLVPLLRKRVRSENVGRAL